MEPYPERMPVLLKAKIFDARLIESALCRDLSTALEIKYLRRRSTSETPR